MQKQAGWRRLAVWMKTAFIVSAICAGSSGIAGKPHEVSAASAVRFSDIDGHWGKETILWAVGQGVVDGFEDGTFLPDKPVSEAEFLTMMLRGFLKDGISKAASNAPWYAPYFAFAKSKGWPVNDADANKPFARGQVAQLIAASQGQILGVNGAIEFLLANGLAQGKTSNDVAGFGAKDTLTRAESVQFIRNMMDRKLTLKTSSQTESSPVADRAFSARGVSLGDSESAVVSRLGSPDRKDASEYGFEWYIYNQDYKQYVQIGIQGGKVVALYATQAWTAKQPGIADGRTAADVVKAFGQPLDSIKKGNTRYMLNNPGEEDGTYEIDDSYVTFFYDTHVNKNIEAILVVAKSVEEAKSGFYGTHNDAVRKALEREVFDITNAIRARRGLAPLTWDDAVAATAYGHSEDMGKNNYFAHTSPSGERLKNRLERDAIDYSKAAENIAAGQPNAIYAISSWLNSHSGHRETMLGDYQYLGVGVYFGGDRDVYFTQNFYTPME